MTTVAGAPILVGTDGSAAGLRVVEAAAREAALRHRPLRIVHALPPSPGLAAEAQELLLERAEQVVGEAAEYAQKTATEITVVPQVITGDPVTVLRDQSRTAELLVLGEQGVHAEVTVGSVAARLTAHAACPVLILRGSPLADGPVVAGVDGSPPAQAALEFAAEEAGRRGAELVVLHTWRGHRSTRIADNMPMSHETFIGEEEHQRMLAEAVAGVAEHYPDVPIRRQVRHGPARRLLTDRSLGAQLIVVGSRGLGGLAAFVLGSVSRHLIRHAACPVVVVPPALPVSGT